MNKVIGLALLVAGVFLIVMGYNASQSFGSDLSRFFTGSASDKALWMLIGGPTSAIAGIIFLNNSHPTT